jgi:hypothetical protein
MTAWQTASRGAGHAHGQRQQGELAGVMRQWLGGTWYHDPYKEPADADVVIDTTDMTYRPPPGKGRLHGSTIEES